MKQNICMCVCACEYVYMFGGVYVMCVVQVCKCGMCTYLCTYTEGTVGY